MNNRHHYANKESQAVLRSIIQILEKQFNKKKSWGETHWSLLISCLAVLVSILFPLISLNRETEKDAVLEKANKIEQIEDLAIKLVEIREKNARVFESPHVDGVSLLGIHNYQRLIHINQIKELINSTDGNLPAPLYSYIGDEVATSGEYEKALEYYTLQLRYARTYHDSIDTYRNLGQFYIDLENPLYNQDSSTFYWNLAIQIAGKFRGDRRYEHNGFTYEIWARKEFFNGRQSIATKLIDSAESNYLLLSDFNDWKAISLNNLNRLVNRESQLGFNKASIILNGMWTSTLENNITVHTHFYPFHDGWYCNTEFYENGKIIMTMSGSSISYTDKRIVFSLQGMKKTDEFNSYLNFIQTFASITFVYDKHSKAKLHASFNEVNTPENKFTVIKSN